MSLVLDLASPATGWALAFPAPSWSAPGIPGVALEQGQAPSTTLEQTHT